MAKITEQRRMEIRRVQALTGERSLTLVLPKHFALDLGIGKGDFLKVCIEDRKLILEKADY
jgi:bifunctional DNA-binding transcriptional regulator/antitoxin component of YhaV-PrlF toxin-antitoxin module